MSTRNVMLMASPPVKRLCDNSNTALFSHTQLYSQILGLWCQFMREYQEGIYPAPGIFIALYSKFWKLQ